MKWVFVGGTLDGQEFEKDHSALRVVNVIWATVKPQVRRIAREYYEATSIGKKQIVFKYGGKEFATRPKVKR